MLTFDIPFYLKISGGIRKGIMGVAAFFLLPKEYKCLISYYVCYVSVIQAASIVPFGYL